MAKSTRVEGGDSGSRKRGDTRSDGGRPASTGKPSLLARLFGRFGTGSDGRLEVRVATLTGSEASDEDTQRLIRAFDGRSGIRARRLSQPFSLEPALDEAQALAATAAAGRRLLAQAHADLLI